MNRHRRQVLKGVIAAPILVFGVLAATTDDKVNRCADEAATDALSGGVLRRSITMAEDTVYTSVFSPYGNDLIQNIVISTDPWGHVHIKSNISPRSSKPIRVISIENVPPVHAADLDLPLFTVSIPNPTFNLLDANKVDPIARNATIAAAKKAAIEFQSCVSESPNPISMEGLEQFSRRLRYTYIRLTS